MPDIAAHKPDAQRAADIADRVLEARKHLIACQQAVRSALALAEDDYPDNNQAIQHIDGALHLVQNSLAQEFIVWSGYSQARKSV